ncbi:MAG TPA: YdcF family protein [Alphaproteobacteria bacterium]|jgi:uncharacterized SAM-binding protein YcdF (DUF218 family)|nr:YdcF family protein [Alphaproteobacteria bacterium]|tara:strand:+ start:618 stop:1184 length:567 start_codon:yes stop_codon:yes gene_type:complete
MRFVGLAVLALLLVGTAGLARFVAGLPTAVSIPDQKSDAIIVLTGGSGRLVEGLELLERGVGHKLFVSGVYRGVDVEELLRVARADGGSESVARIALGHDADDTRGNARETAAWMSQQSYDSLRLVTAAYHMPRSLLEFHRAMPEITLIAHPVFPDSVRLRDWWRHPGTLMLLVSEYGKYLLSRFVIR